MTLRFRVFHSLGVLDTTTWVQHLRCLAGNIDLMIRSLSSISSPLTKKIRIKHDIHEEDINDLEHRLHVSSFTSLIDTNYQFLIPVNGTFSHFNSDSIWRCLCGRVLRWLLERIVDRQYLWWSKNAWFQWLWLMNKIHFDWVTISPAFIGDKFSGEVKHEVIKSKISQIDSSCRI